MKSLLLLSIIVVVAVEDVTSATKEFKCYQCITRSPSWALEPCDKNDIVKCTVGNYCTKANFGGSLTIRGCAPSGLEKEFAKDGKLCKKTLTLMNSKKVLPEMKKKFAELKKNFEASCPQGNILKKAMKNLTKDPKKGFTCKKQLCNGGDRVVVGAATFPGVVVALVATTAVYFTHENR